ncbi:unnamed protein product [Cylindrotheca closterium]|uniref:RanBP2-type domain-containing protein n=1 Tax=Cylindrotheca closterium TaxID=2856 RepID=A0AAD2FM23_9STRA|nr:unnamed protein product [Cylindrotheca closterium]
MVDHEPDVEIRRLLSIESSELSIEELQSIHSISSISEESLELPPQAGSVRVPSNSKYAPSQQRIPPTSRYINAADQGKDNMSLNSSRFSLGLNASGRLKGRHGHGQRTFHQSSDDDSRSESSEEHSSTMSLKSSNQEDDSCSDHMEIAALLAKAKGGSIPVYGKQQEVSGSFIQSKGMLESGGTLLDKSPSKPMTPTKITVSSPKKSSTADAVETEETSSPEKSIGADAVEAEETKWRCVPSIQSRKSIENIQKPASSKQASGTQLDERETDADRQSQRVSQSSLVLLPVPPSPTRTYIQKEERPSPLLTPVPPSPLRNSFQKEERLSSLFSPVSSRTYIQKEERPSPLLTSVPPSPPRNSFQKEERLSSLFSPVPSRNSIKKEERPSPLASPVPPSPPRNSSPLASPVPSSPPRNSSQNEERLFEGKQEDRQSCESYRESRKSISQERDHCQDRGLSTRGERAQDAIQIEDGNQQSCESRRKSISHHTQERELVQTSATIRDEKAKTRRTDFLKILFSGSQKSISAKGEKQEAARASEEWRDNTTFRRDFQSRKTLQTPRERFSWEGYQSSRIRNEWKDDSRRRSWAFEKTEKGFKSKRKPVTRAQRSTRVQVEAKGRHSIPNINICVPQVVKRSNVVTPLQEEKKREVPRKEYKSRESERQGNNDSTLRIPKADCRPISEKWNESFRYGRHCKAGFRTTYHSPKLASRMESNDEYKKLFQRGYKVESRQDSFDGERMLQVEQNPFTETSTPAFKCRTLSDKERLMRVYQEKEKLANEFIANWTKLSGMTTGDSHMRQNDQQTFATHNKYNSETRLPNRNAEVSPWSRISSLTNESKHAPTMAKAHPTHRHRQLGVKKKRWVCDICGVVNFESYAACFIHEKNCTGPARDAIIENNPRGQNWLLSE